MADEYAEAPSGEDGVDSLDNPSLDIQNWYEVPEVNAELVLFRPQRTYDDIEALSEQNPDASTEELRQMMESSGEIASVTVEMLDFIPPSPPEYIRNHDANPRAVLVSRFRIPRNAFKYFVDSIITDYEELFGVSLPQPPAESE